MKLSEQNRMALLLSLHREIEEHAHHSANHLLHGRSNELIQYPPNGGFTQAELDALSKLTGDETLRDALRKAFASNTAEVFFNFFNILDGTGDPGPGMGDWTEVKLVDFNEAMEEEGEMLHDHFFETYWLWRKKRKADWKLDLHDGD